MRSMLVAFALVSPLFVVGCKKKEPEPAPVAAAPAPKADLAWSFGPATFDGSRADGNTGALKIPFTVTNNSGSALDLKALSASVNPGEAKVCSGKTSYDGTAAAGGTFSGSIEIACEYKLLPSGATLPIRGLAIYALGAEEREEKYSADVTFTR